MNALLFEFDFDTIVWFHKMFIEANEIIQTGLKDLGIEQDTDPNPDHQDIRAEIIMPKVLYYLFEISSHPYLVQYRRFADKRVTNHFCKYA